MKDVILLVNGPAGGYVVAERILVGLFPDHARHFNVDSIARGLHVCVTSDQLVMLMARAFGSGGARVLLNNVTPIECGSPVAPPVIIGSPAMPGLLFNLRFAQKSSRPWMDIARPLADAWQWHADDVLDLIEQCRHGVVSAVAGKPVRMDVECFARMTAARYAHKIHSYIKMTSPEYVDADLPRNLNVIDLRDAESGR